MKKFWQVILGIGSILTMVLGILAMMLKGDTVASAKVKQVKLKKEAQEKKENLKQKAEKEKARLAARSSEEIIEEYYVVHPKIDRESDIQKHVAKAMKAASKYKKVSL